MTEMPRRIALVACFASLLTAGCNAILGLGDYSDQPAGTGATGGSAGGGSGGTAGAAGGGGAGAAGAGGGANQVVECAPTKSSVTVLSGLPLAELQAWRGVGRNFVRYQENGIKKIAVIDDDGVSVTPLEFPEDVGIGRAEGAGFTLYGTDATGPFAQKIQWDGGSVQLLGGKAYLSAPTCQPMRSAWARSENDVWAAIECKDGTDFHLYSAQASASHTLIASSTNMDDIDVRIERLGVSGDDTLQMVTTGDPPTNLHQSFSEDWTVKQALNLDPTKNVSVVLATAPAGNGIFVLAASATLAGQELANAEVHAGIATSLATLNALPARGPFPKLVAPNFDDELVSGHGLHGLVVQLGQSEARVVFASTDGSKYYGAVDVTPMLPAGKEIVKVKLLPANDLQVFILLAILDDGTATQNRDLVLREISCSVVSR